MNARMDTLQCAILIEKLGRFPWEVEQRAKVGKRYSQEFASLEGKLITPTVLQDRTSVYAQYTIWTQERDKLRPYLADKGIPTAVHYPMPMYRQDAYKAFHKTGALQNCDWASSGVVSLPMHADLDEATQDRVIEAVKAFFG